MSIVDDVGVRAVDEDIAVECPCVVKGSVSVEADAVGSIRSVVNAESFVELFSGVIVASVSFSVEFQGESLSVSSTTEAGLLISVVSSLIEDCSVVDVEIAVSEVLLLAVVGRAVVCDADVVGR